MMQPMSLAASVRSVLPRVVRTFEPEEVTTRSRAEVDPRDVGLTPKAVEAMWRPVVRYYEMGLHPALQLCVRVKGEIVIDRAIGHARGNGPDDPKHGPKELATPETLFNLFSGSKSITAMLIHLLHQRGQLHVDEPVQNCKCILQTLRVRILISFLLTWKQI
jgi:CubicO group peptidase (beta-lactamase class C family)